MKLAQSFSAIILAYSSAHSFCSPVGFGARPISVSALGLIQLVRKPFEVSSDELLSPAGPLLMKMMKFFWQPLTIGLT
jgi:hypothetical protein